jgi:hypothetical protein
MRWKKRSSNLIVVSILSIAYTIVTLLIIIGPLHVNSAGNMYHLSAETVYALIFWLVALTSSWVIYLGLRNRPELLFFTLILSAIVIIIAEVFLWGWLGP